MCINDQTFYIFRYGWIDCKDTFRAVLHLYWWWAENEWILSALANRFSTNNPYAQRNNFSNLLESKQTI